MTKGHAMQSTQWSRSKGYIVVGAIGICLSAFYLALSFQMPMGRIRQPGAGVFPVISGFFLLLGSVSALWEGFKIRKSESVELPTGSDLKRLLVVIGGIFELTETENEARVPFLGDLPGVGNLFKNRQRSSNKQEMLVFITPKMITDRAGLR